ncbi:MAG: hypothetical protein JJU13_13995 [Balneolaceae bacterium]|nr:hypothetical protein [Balneolaceae bacterium]
MKPTPGFSVCWVMMVFLTFGWITTSCDIPDDEITGIILEPIQPVFDADSPTQAIGGSSEQMLAQTFTVERDGNLAGVYLPIGCSDGTLEIEIRNVEDDIPGSTLLAENSFVADDIRSGVGVFERLRFPEVSVTAGQQLSFVLKNETGSCGMSRAPTGDSYTGGEAYFDARPNEPGWRPLTIGTGIHDLVFLMVMELE